MAIVLNYDHIAGEIVEKLKVKLFDLDLNSLTKLASNELPESLSPEEAHNFMKGMVVVDDLMTEAKALENICNAAREAGQTGTNLATALFFIDLANTMGNSVANDPGWDDFISCCRESLKEGK